KRFFHQSLESLHDAASLHIVKFSRVQSASLKHFTQHKSITRSQCIYPYLPTSQVGHGLDLWDGNQAKKAVITAHEGNDIGFSLCWRCSLTFNISYDVVH